MAIEWFMFGALGFFLGCLLGLMLAPPLWNRAVKLTTRRLEATMPMTLAEIQADKDQIRADFAIQLRKVEGALEKSKEKAARELIEANKRRVEIQKLNGSLESAKGELHEAENANRVLQQTIKRRLPDLDARLKAAKKALSDLETVNAELRTTISSQSEALKTARATVHNQRTDIDQLRLSLESGTVSGRGSSKADGKAVAENQRLTAELSRAQEELALARTSTEEFAFLRRELSHLASQVLDAARHQPPAWQNTAAQAAAEQEPALGEPALGEPALGGAGAASSLLAASMAATQPSSFPMIAEPETADAADHEIPQTGTYEQASYDEAAEAQQTSGAAQPHTAAAGEETVWQEEEPQWQGEDQHQEEDQHAAAEPQAGEVYEEQEVYREEEVYDEHEAYAEEAPGGSPLPDEGNYEHEESLAAQPAVFDPEDTTGLEDDDFETYEIEGDYAQLGRANLGYASETDDAFSEDDDAFSEENEAQDQTGRSRGFLGRRNKDQPQKSRGGSLSRRLRGLAADAPETRG